MQFGIVTLKKNLLINNLITIKQNETKMRKVVKNLNNMTIII